MPCLVFLDGHEEKGSKRRKERGQGNSINLAMGLFSYFGISSQPSKTAANLDILQGEADRMLSLNLQNSSTVHQFPHGTELLSRALATYKLSQLARTCARQIFSPCFESPFARYLKSLTDTNTLMPSYKSFQHCYRILTVMKASSGKVCMPALLQGSECFSFFTFSFSISCWFCLITKCAQAIAPPPVQNWALVQIVEPSKKFS